MYFSTRPDEELQSKSFKIGRSILSRSRGNSCSQPYDTSTLTNSANHSTQREVVVECFAPYDDHRWVNIGKVCKSFMLSEVMKNFFAGKRRYGP